MVECIAIYLAIMKNLRHQSPLMRPTICANVHYSGWLNEEGQSQSCRYVYSNVLSTNEVSGIYPTELRWH